MPDSAGNVGSGPDATGLINLDGGVIQPVETYNRAGFDAVVEATPPDSVFDYIAEAVGVVSSLLPGKITYSTFRQPQKDNSAKYFSAFGVKGELSISKRVAALFELAGASSSIASSISKFLPEISAGFSIGFDSTQTLISGQVEIALPEWIEAQLGGV